AGVAVERQADGEAAVERDDRRLQAAADAHLARVARVVEIGPVGDVDGDDRHAEAGADLERRAEVVAAAAEGGAGAQGTDRTEGVRLLGDDERGESESEG